MKKAIILSSALSLLFVITASAQLKVSSSGNVSVGTTANAASTLSVNAIGDTLYAAFINGNCKVDSGYISAVPSCIIRRSIASVSSEHQICGL